MKISKLLTGLTGLVIGALAWVALGQPAPQIYSLTSSNASVTFHTNINKLILDLSVTTGGATNGIQQLNGFGTNTTFNGATVHNGARVDTNYVYESFTTNGPVINVKAFGAVGDGIADDTVAFTNAIWHAAGIAYTNTSWPATNSLSSFNTVFVPAGNYKVTGVLDLLTFTNADPSYVGAVNLVGAGARNTEIVFYGNTNGLQAIGLPPGNCIGPTIRGLRLRADNNVATNTMDAVHFADVRNARVEDCDILHWYGAAIYWTNVSVSTTKNVFSSSNGGTNRAAFQFAKCFEIENYSPVNYGTHTNQIGVMAIDNSVSINTYGGDLGGGNCPILLVQETIPSSDIIVGHSDNLNFYGTGFESGNPYYIKAGGAFSGTGDCWKDSVFSSVSGTISQSTNIWEGVHLSHCNAITFDRSIFHGMLSPATTNEYNFVDCSKMTIIPAFQNVNMAMTYVATNGVADTSANRNFLWQQGFSTIPSGPAVSPFTVGDGTGDARIYMDRVAPDTAGPFWMTTNALRWSLVVQASDAGSDPSALQLVAYDDSSTAIGVPSYWSRRTLTQTNYNLTVKTNFVVNGQATISNAHIDTNFVGQLITTNGPQVNILAFGADPTFTTDSHDAIQAALDSIAVTNSMGIGTGGTVLVPPGKFLVSTNLLIPKGVRLVGTSIGFANWNSGSQLIFTNTGPAISVSINSELANLNIWGVSNAPVAGSWGICGTNSAARYRVQNCRLQYFDDGIHLDDTFIATFQDVIVNYCTNAVHTTNNSVNAISFQGMQSNFEVNNVGFLLETAGAGLSTGFTIDSVVIEGNNAGILCTGNIADLTIRSVYFEGNGAYDITINNSSMEGALITGNVLNGTGTNIVLTAARGPIIFANNFETQNVGTPKALLIASGVRDAYVGRNYYRLLPAAFTPSTDDAGNGTQVDERGINLLNRSTAITSDSILQERTANGNYKAGLDWTSTFISSSPFGGIYGYPSTYGPGASNVFSELVNTNQTLVWAGATGTPQLKIGTVGAGRLSWYWNSQEQALIDVNGINLKCPLLITPAPVLPQDAIATYKIFSGFFKGGFDMVSTFVSASNPMGGFYGYPSAYTNGTGLSVFGHAIATNMVASWSTASGNTEFQYGSAGTGAVRGYWDSIEKTRIDNSGVSVLAPLIVTGATTTDSGTATNSWSVGSLNQGSTKILTAGQHLTNLVDLASGSGVALSLSGTNVSVIGQHTSDNSIATNGYNVPTIGKGITIKAGANGRLSSTAETLSAGTVVVNNTSITANSKVFLQPTTVSPVSGVLAVTAKSVGTSFTVTSSNNQDTNQFSWFIVEAQ